MCNRRESIQVGVVLVVAAMMIGGMSPQVAAQTSDFNEEIFQRLSDEDKEALAEDFSIYKEQITGVDFTGELRLESFTLKEPRAEDVVLKNVIVQQMTATNCGSVADSIHLAVTTSKATEQTVTYDHTWGVSVGYTMKWGAEIFGTKIENEFSVAAEYAYSMGGSESTITSTSWEQGIEVSVPPHQIVPVDFIGLEEEATRDFEQTFTAYGKATLQIADPDPREFNICVQNDQGDYSPAEQCYDEPTVVDQFYNPALNDKIDKVLRKGPSEWDPENPDPIWANYPVRVELYRDYSHTADFWVWDSENPDEVGIPSGLLIGQNQVSSMRIIDMEQPHACIYYDADFSEGTFYKRCFNVGQHDPGLGAGLNDHVYSIKIVGDIKVTLCRGYNYQGGCRVYTKSIGDTGAEDGGTATSVKIESLEAEQTFYLDEYLTDSEREFSLKGTYERVGMLTGWFEKRLATKATYEDCGCDNLVYASPDCEEHLWCDKFPSAPGCGQVNVFSVFIKSKGSGAGKIWLNGADRGTDFAISYTLDNIPALHKLEAIPDVISTFAGWETATGTPILVGDQPYTPLPGETIYAVFDLQ